MRKKLKLHRDIIVCLGTFMVEVKRQQNLVSEITKLFSKIPVPIFVGVD
jgi:hypothetical protein